MSLRSLPPPYTPAVCTRMVMRTDPGLKRRPLARMKEAEKKKVQPRKTCRHEHYMEIYSHTRGYKYTSAYIHRKRQIDVAGSQ